MKNLIVMALFISCIPFTGYTQQSGRTTHHKHVKAAKATILPHWAASDKHDPAPHTPIPDYYSYYDAQQGGYVYWENGKYSLTPAAAPALENTGNDRSELYISKAFSLDLHPQLDYPYYMTQYPIMQGNSRVPTPLTDNPAGR